MSQIDKIKQRTPCGDKLFESQLQEGNRKFFPFYVFTNFEVKLDDPIYCDYCGEVLEGNGSYECAYFVFYKSGEIKICCSIRSCMKEVDVWEYHHQIFGQSRPLSLPENPTQEMKLVYREFFGNCPASFHIMQYAKIDSWEQFSKIVYISLGGGGTYEDDPEWYRWTGNKLIAYNYVGENDELDIKISLTKNEILNVVNEMLAAMRFVQLQLF